MVITAVRAGLRGCHRVAGATEEGVVEEHRCDAQLGRVELCKDVVSIIGTIVTPYTCMIAAYNEMRAAIVLAHQGMEDRFAWTSVTHGSRKHTQDDTTSRVVVRQQHFITTHTYIGGNIVALGITHERMQVQAINCFHGTLLDVLMGTVHRIACLKTNNTLPTMFCKQLARLGRSVAILGKGLILQGNHAHWPTKQDIALLVHRFHTRMRFFCCAIDFACLVLLIVAILLFNRHDGLERTMLIEQGSLRAFFQGSSLFRSRRERNRYR